jgi:hypothetical protein
MTVEEKVNRLIEISKLQADTMELLNLKLKELHDMIQQFSDMQKNNNN